MGQYGVSYQQVYAWVRKYQAGHAEALQDHRGRRKPVEELDEHERLKLRIKELEARNEYLENENAFAKKVGRDQATKETLTLVRHVVLYQAIYELHQEKGYAIRALCVLASVARSAYYKWLKWTLSDQECEIYMLAKEVRRRYDKRNGILGYRQMSTQLNRKLNKQYNKKRYYRIMRALGLQAVIRKKRPRYVKTTAIHVAKNKENRHSNNNKLVMDTLKKAHAHNPGVSPMLQSDRGFQYTSHEYARLQLKYGFTKSMSRVIPLSA